MNSVDFKSPALVCWQGEQCRKVETTAEQIEKGMERQEMGDKGNINSGDKVTTQRERLAKSGRGRGIVSERGREGKKQSCVN